MEIKLYFTDFSYFMNLKQLIFWTTWASILAWAIYFSQWEEFIHEPVRLVQDATRARTQEMVSPFWVIGTPWVQYISPKVAQYMSTNTDTPDMADSNMETMLALQEFEHEQKEIYNQAHRSPLWNRAPQGKESVLYGRLELLKSLSLRLDQLDTNPGLEQQLIMLWFSRNNLITDNWSEWEWIYRVIDTLREIDTLSIEAKERFFASDLWKNYLNGHIRIQDIEDYLNGQN